MFSLNSVEYTNVGLGAVLHTGLIILMDVSLRSFQLTLKSEQPYINIAVQECSVCMNMMYLPLNQMQLTKIYL